MHLGGRREIESTGHVVRDYHARSLGQRARHLEPLAISTRERRRNRLGSGGAHPKPGQHVAAQFHRARDIELAGTRGFKAAIEENRVDALMFPGWNISNLASRPGYPEIVVPLGMLPANAAAANPFPPGFDPKPTPYSAAFVGLACSEPKLIEIAYAFEQATKRRVPPSATP